MIDSVKSLGQVNEEGCTIFFKIKYLNYCISLVLQQQSKYCEAVEDHGLISKY